MHSLLKHLCLCRMKILSQAMPFPTSRATEHREDYVSVHKHITNPNIALLCDTGV